MFSWLLEWWSDQSPWIRYGVSGFFLLVSTILFFCGWFWPWGWAIGAVLLMLGGPSDSEKKGYRF
jgi:hypothetical protein